MRVRNLMWDKNPDGAPYRLAIVDCELGKTVQIVESPTGRSVQVHVLDDDGWKKVYP